MSGSIAFDYEPGTWRLATEQVGATTLTYSYDADGLVTTAGVGASSTCPSSTCLAITRSPEDGSIDTAEIGSVQVSATYDGLGRSDVWTTTWPRSGSYVEDLDIGGASAIHGAGRIVLRSESDGVAVTATGYGYDPVGRLTGVYTNSVPTASYQYDGQGNRIAWTDDRGDFVGIYDAQDRLERVERPGGAVEETYTYDGHGQLTSRTDVPTGEVTMYEYDARGALLEVASSTGPTITYRVDALGRRVQRRVGGVVDRAWLYRDDLRPIAELRPDGTVRALFVYATRGHAPDLMIEPGGATYYLVKDHLGSVVRVVNVDTGDVEQRREYDAFGRILPGATGLSDLHPFGFAGGLYDPDTGLTRFGARDYDPSVGRWTAKDPALFGGGDTNLYAYVANDPVNQIDPSGLVVDTALDVIFIGYDIYSIFNDNILGDCDNLGVNLAALGLDLLGLAVPFATGLGAGARGAAHADDAYDALRHADDLIDATRGCFEAGTMVSTADGPQPIETLAAGDLVWSFDPEAEEPVLREVLEALVRPDQPLMEVALEDEAGEAQVLRVTPEHPFGTDRSWVEARHLEAGDVVRTLSGGWLRVTSATWAQTRATVYNLRVDGLHSYFVSEVGGGSDAADAAWVHNGGCQRLTRAARRILGGIEPLKDMPVADAIRLRGGGGRNVNEVATNLQQQLVGDVANLAAAGDSAAQTAIKIIKDAGRLGQRY